MVTIQGYTELEPIHEGVSSYIYRARRIADNHPVVIKVSTQKALSEKKAQRFRREFELGQSIDSPYVVKYLDFKQNPAYGMALIMEDDKAVELTSVIPDIGFSEADFLGIAIQIVQGLQAIHLANLVHNDLKPSNILIQPQTRHIKIIDFNRASALRQEKQSAVSTKVEVGTLAYLSPEQTGRINRQVDYRTDFYSLGVTFYRLLCGRLPFTATDVLGLIHQHLAKEPQSPQQLKSSVSLSLSQLILKLLEKEAENRYQSCEGLLHDLNVCQQSLQKTGKIPEFELGQQDFSSKLTLSQHLYGRDDETKILKKTFERVCEGKREALMVAGQPGVGKSMLIQEIQQPITLQNGFFLQGKFDQLNKNVAYSALTQALDGLIKQLLMEDEGSIARWKERVQSALGDQAQLIVQVVPSLALLIGPQQSAHIADPTQAKNVFNRLFQEFIKVFANAEHPLVLFLDDLQWADSASLDVMTYLMTQPNITNLLWIGAYRDTEVSASHPAMQVITALREAQVSVKTLPLAPLKCNSLQQWIADSLRMPLDAMQPLAELIHQKTAGNPFFVKLFLQSLYDQQLLTFSLKTHWQWDLAKISQLQATENVISLMTFQLKQLPSDTQQALKVASCLGHHLALNTLQMALEKTQDSVCDQLRPALNSGILIQTNDELYFAHDRVQEAAYALLSEPEKLSLHLTIGQRLFAHRDYQEVLLFDMVSQFNRCYSLLNVLQQRLQLAELSLQAGQKAKQAAAYAAALDYLYASKAWIDAETIWQTNYSLAFSLYKELAEVEYLSGNLDKSQTLIAAMQPHLLYPLDKVDIYYLLIVQKTLHGHYHEAIVLGHRALELLGSGLPLDNPTEFIQQITRELKQKLQGIQIASLLDKPLVTDPEKQATFKILGSIYSACYQSGSEILDVVTFMSNNLSLTYGHAPESCLSYAMYGLLLCGKFKEYTLGYEFGQLAVKLAQKLKDPVQRCRSEMVMQGFTYPWLNSIQHLSTAMTSTYQACLACGELEFAGYCVLMITPMRFNQGAPLAKVQQEALPLLQFAENSKNQIARNTVLAVQMLAANLMGDTVNERSFDIGTIDEKQFETHCQQSNTFNALCIHHILKAQALYLYGYFKQSFDSLEQANSRLHFIKGNYMSVIYNWYDSLTRLALYSSSYPEDPQAHLQQIEKNQKQLEIWAESCQENFAHKYALVQAELARIKDDQKTAESCYDQAIELAGRHGFIQEQALAAELAAKYWIARGKPLCAQGYLNAAFNGYKQWGAKRKLGLLKTKYADLLQALAPTGLSQLVVSQETTLSSNTLRYLDLSSILKASHAISSEIELPKLLRLMMQIIIENVGAQKGAVFFVEADENIFVQAEYLLDGQITTLQRTPLASWTNGAQVVIQYVKSFHQEVVIGNAWLEKEFSDDPYVRRVKAKSILCIPILKHAELKAILYVENNLISSAFTPELKLTALILTAQMAISLENAKYFAEQLALVEQIAMQSARAKMAEQSLRAVTHDYHLALDASKAGTWNWQLGTGEITWDDLCHKLFGLKPGEFQGTYQAFLDYVHPEDKKDVDESVKRCLAENKPLDIVHRVIWPEDKSVHMITGRGNVYCDESGRQVKMAGVCLDITHRKQLEEAKLRAQLAEEQRKSREQFIDTLCHEIRNPLTGLLGHIEILKEVANTIKALASERGETAESPGPLLNCAKQLDESVVAMEECGDHQREVLNQVLELSRLEAGKLTPKIEPFLLCQAIQSVTSIYQARIKEKQLQFKLQLPEQDYEVESDATRFKQIIINLLSNAVKYTKENDSITLAVSLEPRPNNQACIKVQVKDSGVGFTDDEKKELFNRFSLLNRNLQPQYDASGLGLAISKGLTELLNGKLTLDSEKWKGSSFNLEFNWPLSVILTAKLIAPEPSLASAAAAEKKLKILVAEDTVINQKILQRLLVNSGYECIIANNGVEAVEQFETSKPDFILMDIEMPMENGIAATKKIRAIEQRNNLKKTPIYALSGYTRDEYKKDAAEAGMDGYITKPYKTDEIKQIISQCDRIEDSLKDPLILQSADAAPVNLAAFKRAGLFRGDEKDTAARVLLIQHLPNKAKLGTALATGDCFFDAFAQSLQSLGRGTYTAKELRLLCHDYVVQLDKGSREDNWIYQRFLTTAKRVHPADENKAIKAASNEYLCYMANIQYMADEMAAGQGLNTETALWGEQDIDGLILRERLNINLHVIELHKHEGTLIVGHQRNGYSVGENSIEYDNQETVHLAVFKNHFVPILPNDFEVEQTVETHEEDLPNAPKLSL